MNAPSLTYTVTMDANLARQVGVPAAMLYNLLFWTSTSDMAQNYDQDGWFYFTAKQFEDKTTFSINTFTKATNALAEAGLIEKKKAYIKGTSVSVCHFRILPQHCDAQLTPNVKPGTHTKCETYIKEENTVRKDRVSPKGETTELLPFGDGIKELSVRPGAKKDKNAANRRAYAVANEVRKRIGMRGEASVGFKMVVSKWLDAGYGADEMVEAIQMMKQTKDGFHDKLTPLACLSQDSMDWYTQHKSKQDKSPKGVW